MRIQLTLIEPHYGAARPSIVCGPRRVFTFAPSPLLLTKLPRADFARVDKVNAFLSRRGSSCMRASSMRRDNRERFQMHAFRQIAPATLICIREPTLGAADHRAIGHSHVLAKSRSEMSDRARPAACRIALSSFSENITDAIVRASSVILPR